MQPEQRLTLDATVADFAVDVANVVRETTLGGSRGADLGRLLAVLDALAVFHRDPAVPVYAVTDRSLMTDGRLTAQERQTLGRWYDDGLLEVRPVADDRLIELAAAGLLVVTDDRFLNYHRAHPWIPGDRHHFLRAVPAPGGGVLIQRRIMPEAPEWQLSRSEEESELLAAGLYDRRGGRGARADLLLRKWRCPEPGCPLFGHTRTGGQPYPTHRGGTVRCPDHGLALEDLGPLPHQAQLKVRVDGDVRHRFLLPEGQELTVGRAPTVPGRAVELAPHVGAAALHWISRNHVVLSLSGQTLTVRDVSANGTRIRRSSGTEVPLRSGAGHRLGRGESVVLHDTVVLERSGRDFPFDPSDTDERPDGRGPGGPGTAPPGEARQPTMLAPEPTPPPPPGRGRRGGGGRKRRRR